MRIETLMRSSKIQNPNPKQILNSKIQPEGLAIADAWFGVWSLEFIWNLRFVIWNFTAI
jgi:hypothetical protein